MTLPQTPQTPSVETVQAELIACLTEEIKVMREILANMHEEQESILRGQKEENNPVLLQRNKLYEELVRIREKRIKTVKQLSFLLFDEDKEEALFKEDHGIPLLLEAKGVDACEILTLRDQMLALIEKMNAQNRRNRDLLKFHISYAPEDLLPRRRKEENAPKPLIKRPPTTMVFGEEQN